MDYKRTPEWWQEHGWKSGEQLARENGEDGGSWRKAKRRALGDVEETEVEAQDSTVSYKESTEILSDGSHRSDKLLRMSAEQSKDPAFLLDAHGFDVTAWELVSAKNNIWNVYSKNPKEGPPHIISTLYSSKITVRPLRSGIDIEAIVAAVRQVEPVTIRPPVTGECLLECAFTDMHIGNSMFDHYVDTLNASHAIIASRQWSEVFFPIGSDLFHCDNFKNTTSNGTPQSSVSWPEAWADALRFYSPLIEIALSQSKVVHAKYIIGNHDESMGWAFCQMLAAKYPQVIFDLDISERKVHTFGDIAIGWTHGDGRTQKDIDRVFMAEFPEFASASVREVHRGHKHHEVVVDQFGVIVRSLPTEARTDKWHREEGYVGAVKRFQLFEYSSDALLSIRYV